MSLSKLFLFLIPVALFGQTLAHDIEINIPGETKIVNDSIKLGEVAQVYVKNIHQFRALSELEIAQFPSDQAELVVPGEYVKQRIMELLGPRADASFKIPAAIKFTRSYSAQNELALIEEIKRLGKESSKFPADVTVNIEIIKMPSVGKDKIKITPAAEIAQWRGEVNFRTSYGEWVKAKINWFMEAWLAKRDLALFTDLKPSDFEKGSINVTALRSLPLAASSTEQLAQTLAGARTKRMLRMKMALASEFIDKKPDTKMGESLKVVFVSSSGLRVEAEGQAVQESHIGLETKARLFKSKKIVTGMLVNPHLMEVSL